MWKLRKATADVSTSLRFAQHDSALLGVRIVGGAEQTVKADADPSLRCAPFWMTRLKKQSVAFWMAVFLFCAAVFGSG
jgi:hypothetical protein